MELSTRCPECETIFQVSLEQLQLRKGYIRCVQCAHIFDGFEAAVPTEATRAATPSAPAQPFSIGAARVAPSAKEPLTEHSIPATTPRSVADAPQEPRIPSVVRQRSDIKAAAKPVVEDFIISDPPARATAAREEPVMSTRAPVIGSVHEPRWNGGDADEEVIKEPLYVEPRNARRSAHHRPDFMKDQRGHRGWLSPIWAILIFCGLLLLGAQAIYIYRAQLANAFPELRPALELACERLSCSVPYERRIDSIAITASALRSSGPPEDGVSNLILEVSLRNTYDRPQEWPTLVLDLKDASGTVVVRRNMGAETWVPVNLRDGPFAAGSEVKVQLPVAVRGLQANGYQLDKFFP